MLSQQILGSPGQAYASCLRRLSLHTHTHGFQVFLAFLCKGRTCLVLTPESVNVLPTLVRSGAVRSRKFAPARQADTVRVERGHKEGEPEARNPHPMVLLQVSARREVLGIKGFTNEDAALGWGPGKVSVRRRPCWMPRKGKGSVPLHCSNSSFHVEQQLPAGTGDVPPRKCEGLCLVGFHNFVSCFGTSDLRHHLACPSLSCDRWKGCQEQCFCYFVRRWLLRFTMTYG